MARWSLCWLRGWVGRRFAVEEITYTAILEQATMLGMKLVSCAFDGEGMKPEALREACTRRKVSGVFPDADGA